MSRPPRLAETLLSLVSGPTSLPAQQKVIADYLGLVRARLVGALDALGIPIEPARNSSSWAIMTTLSFAEIAIQDVSPGRLVGYGPLDEKAARAIEQLEADLERTLRRLRTYVSQGLGKDLGARLKRLEEARPTSVCSECSKASFGTEVWWSSRGRSSPFWSTSSLAASKSPSSDA